MAITRTRSSWLAILALFLFSSITHAGIVGSHASKGVLNVTFSKQNQKPVKTVSSSDEVWTFNANKTFARGDATQGDVLIGRWKRKPGNLIEATYNRIPYNTHLSNFWANLGVNVSNIRILTNKVLVLEVSNGLRIEETLVYSMDVAENGRSKRATVSIRGSFVASDGASENPALRNLFPTMWQDQVATSSEDSFSMIASSAVVTAIAEPVAIYQIYQEPASNFQLDRVIAQPDATPTPQQ